MPTLEEYKTAVGKTRGNNSELQKQRREGCTVSGTIHIPRVGGTLSVSVSPDAWRRATSVLAFGMDLTGGNTEQVDPFHGRLPNVTHYVHDVTFNK